MPDQLKIMLTIDEVAAGPLLVAAIKLGAQLVGMAVVQSLPYTKNAPRLVHANGDANGEKKKIGRPKGSANRDKNDGPPPFQIARGTNPELTRAAITAVIAALEAAGTNGLHKKEVFEIYVKVRGKGNGLGNALKKIINRKGDRVFLKRAA